MLLGTARLVGTFHACPRATAGRHQPTACATPGNNVARLAEEALQTLLGLIHRTAGERPRSTWDGPRWHRGWRRGSHQQGSRQRLLPRALRPRTPAVLPMSATPACRPGRRCLVRSSCRPPPLLALRRCHLPRGGATCGRTCSRNRKYCVSTCTALATTTLPGAYFGRYGLRYWPWPRARAARRTRRLPLLQYRYRRRIRPEAGVVRFVAGLWQARVQRARSSACRFSPGTAEGFGKVGWSRHRVRVHHGQGHTARGRTASSTRFRQAVQRASVSCAAADASDSRSRPSACAPWPAPAPWPVRRTVLLVRRAVAWSERVFETTRRIITQLGHLGLVGLLAVERCSSLRQLSQTRHDGAHGIQLRPHAAARPRETTARRRLERHSHVRTSLCSSLAHPPAVICKGREKKGTGVSDLWESSQTSRPVTW